ncbi:hypothetical protein CcaverHIS002_0601480 [Cutaneotrichosporon cavernicola]|nr:hypothetical protein CcaverHIS002_0601480 [Cutaneotrichosporon cavernicola]
MSHLPQTPDASLPSALTQLFAEGEHFLRPSADMLIDPGLEDSQTVAAIAAAAAEQAQAAEHAAEQELLSHEIDLPLPEKQSALEVVALSLRTENDRLRRAVSYLEAQGLGLEVEGPLPALPLEMDVNDFDISQHTLRELASAAAGEAFFPALEGLHNIHVEEENSASMADFLHGLVAQVTVPRTREARPKTVDPFEIARRGIEAEIETTRVAIAEKEAEIAANKEGKSQTALEKDDKAGLDAQVVKVTSALDGARTRAAVLRDAVLRLKRERDAVHFDVLGMEAELAVMGDGGRAAASARVLRDIRSYLEDVLKNYKENGKLPAQPLPSLPPLMLATMAPPSSLPKKRGRPPRSATRASVVPAQLAHLVPEADEVAARAEHAPIRRKGIKRNKIELEREALRINEETEMMKSLARMGVWKGDEWVEELIHLFPSATHPALPVASSILSTLRALTAPGKGNDLRAEERAALVGVSALLACERIKMDPLSPFMTPRKKKRQVEEDGATPKRARVDEDAVTPKHVRMAEDEHIIGDPQTPSRRSARAAAKMREREGVAAFLAMRPGQSLQVVEEEEEAEQEQQEGARLARRDLEAEIDDVLGRRVRRRLRPRRDWTFREAVWSPNREEMEQMLASVQVKDKGKAKAGDFARQISDMVVT